MRNKVTDLGVDQNRSLNVTIEADDSIQEITLDNNQNLDENRKQVFPGTEIKQLNVNVN